MAYGDEPQYIDDDEYYDPDEIGGAGNSNVLGASGTRRSRGEAAASRTPAPDGDRGITRRERSGGRATKSNRAALSSGKPRQHSRSNQRPSPPQSAKSKDKSGRQVANSSPQSDKKRGKLSSSKSTDSAGGRRSFNLRRLLRRRESVADAKTRSTNRNQNSAPGRFSALTRGFGRMRHRLGGKAAAAAATGSRREQADKATDAKETRRSIRAAFGAGRGEQRRSRTDAQRAKSAGTSFTRASENRDSSSDQRPSKAPIFTKSDWLDLDRKLDLIGVALVFGAIVLFFSALSSEQAAINAVNTLVGQLLGWGALAVPLTMFAIGMWLIIRHFGDQAPAVDPIRLAGAVLALLGILIVFQFVESFSYAEFIAAVGQCQDECVRVLAENSWRSGRGGGYVGAWIYLALVNNLTEIGGFMVALMILTFATMMTTRMSMAEIATVTIGFSRGVRTTLARQAARRRAQRLQAQEQLALAGQESHVRVAKPAPATLPAAPSLAYALPQPSAPTMPIPLRLRNLFSRRPNQSAELELEEARVEAARESMPAAESGGRFGRLFRRGGGATEDSPSITADVERNMPISDGHVARSSQQPRPEPTEKGASWRDIPRPKLNPNWRAGKKPSPPTPPPVPKANDIALKSAPATDKTDTPPRTAAEDEPADPVSGRATTKKHKETPHPTKSAAAGDMAVADGKIEREAAGPVAESTEDYEELPDQVMIAAAARYGRPTETSADEQPAASDPGTSPQPRVTWQLPDFRELLTGGSTGEMDEEVLLHHAQIIEDTLASFGAPGRVVELNTGPVITQFGVEPDYLTAKSGKRNRVKVSAIAQLDKDLQLALGAKSIRVEAPVPGKGYVGIEVPNPDSAMVSLRDVMEARAFQRIDSPLAIALGKSVDGSPIAADLSQMPHLLIAGTTGSGKSKCINAIIISLLANCSPDEVKFIMVDPKRVELTGYNGLPHLVSPVVVEMERIVGVLRWVTKEMDQRYRKFSKAGARNIIDYNSVIDGEMAQMPYIVVIIDELADLMMMAPDETERAISRIAALARATGIHLVIATQRPSVDVVTGLIKANFPARIAFAVAGSVDSRVILDQPGAERLLGKGDMLYLSGDAPAPLRMQGVFVSDEEINVISRFWKLQNHGLEAVKPIDMPSVPLRRSAAASGNGDSAGSQSSQTAFWDMSQDRDREGMAAEDKTGNPDPQDDELYQPAVDMVRRLDKASISLLQRRLRIGYTRAARLIDMMEERGVVGPPKEGSSKPRDVLPAT